MPRASTALVREFRTIDQSFRKLARSFGHLQPALATLISESSQNGTARSRRRPRLTATQRAALKLQGKYMGTMRGLTPAKRAKVKKVRVEKGIRAAIREAVRMAGL